LYVLTGSHNTFRKNSVYNVTNNILGITVAADQCGMGLQESADNLVEYNNFSFIKNSGVDYYYENRSTVRYNYFYHLNAGGAYPHGTNLSIYGNIFNLDNAEIGMNADPIWQGKILVYDNVFYGTKSLGLMVTSSIGAVTFRNNIVFGGTSGILLTDFDSKTDSDYNCFYAIGSASFRKNGVSYSSLSAFQIATGSDVHSIYSDPQFVSSTPLVAGDFKLKSASLCINAGADLKAQGIIPQSQELRDYAGTIIPQGAGYDIGAFEYAG
jgi:hypothetical protein